MESFQIGVRKGSFFTSPRAPSGRDILEQLGKSARPRRHSDENDWQSMRLHYTEGSSAPRGTVVRVLRCSASFFGHREKLRIRNFWISSCRSLIPPLKGAISSIPMSGMNPKRRRGLDECLPPHRIIVVLTEHSETGTVREYE